MTDNEESKEKARHRSPSPDVKSKAVVKYTSVQWPVEFARLQCNTDLKMPPSNWLSSSTDSYGLRHALSQSVGFSSFRMAHMFPDCVGEVDVVSGAECIKSLLKLPYHPNGMISMMVHRVENTLLLDDFDIFRYLMKSEWSWMKQFFYDNVIKSLKSKDKVTYVKNKSRFALQQKSLVSKFLYHSLIPSSQAREYKETAGSSQLPTLPITGPDLPEPNFQENIPDPGFSNHTYNRNVVWTFEDIQMLIGSDMPIFGGVDRPCVSLRLRDASEPINVLTGIDYWLDNLMCNVPEIVMCYHLDGIVQKYEPIKTEDLPNLENSKFSPKVIRNVAQNILSFLKSNATKAGHTYWLFKGTHDDVVKLYDLTTLCGTAGNPADESPFTIPVAMLLYRVARNMRLPCQAGHIRLLLENCIKLLPIEKYPQIVASSHYMLANLYVPANTNPGNPCFKETSSGECECGDPATCRRRDEDEEENITFDDKSNRSESSNKSHETNTAKASNGTQMEDTKSKQGKGNDENISQGVDVNSLMKPNVTLPSTESPPPSVDGRVGERCVLALSHVKDGLEALKLLNFDKESNYEDIDEGAENTKKEDEPKMARPFEPIPMNYEPLHPKEDICKMARSDIPIVLGYPKEVSNSQAGDTYKADLVKQEKSGRRRRKKRHSTDAETASKDMVSKQEMDNLIQKQEGGVLLRKGKSLPTWQEPSSNDDPSWNIHLKVLLYEKTCLSFATLAEQHYKDGLYGLSFKYIVLAQKCQNICKILNNSHAVEDTCLLGRAGDNLFQFSKHWEKYESSFLKQINSLSNIEQRIMNAVESDLKMYKENDNNKTDAFSNLKSPTDIEQAMISSCQFYNEAMKLTPEDQKEELLRRIASVKNELGVKYMYHAQEQYTLFCNEAEGSQENNGKAKDPLYEVYAKKSLACLLESARIFQQVKDLPNLALLHCNTGRFMRFKAHCNQINHSTEQRRLYSQAVNHYAQALKLLLGQGCEGVRDLVRWELSTALFTQACLLQDSPPDTTDAASEAAEALRVALKNCPLMPGPRQCLYQFRAAVLHHRLASLFHNQYRDPKYDKLDLAKRKAMATLSKINYEQAVKLFLPLEDTSMFLTVQMEHVALMEFQANNSAGIKMKCLQGALELLQECEPAVKLIAARETLNNGSISSQSSDVLEKSLTEGSVKDANKKLIDNDKTANNKIQIEKNKERLTDDILDKDDDLRSEFKLLTLFQQRLQFVLKTLIQLCLQKHSGVSKKDCDRMSACYKSMYSITLKIGKFDYADRKLFAKHLCDALDNMKVYSKEKDF